MARPGEIGQLAQWFTLSFLSVNVIRLRSVLLASGAPLVLLHIHVCKADHRYQRFWYSLPRDDHA